MATAPRLRASLLDPEVERSKVYDPLKKSLVQSTAVQVGELTPRNPGDAIKRFQMEKAYGMGRRRKSRKLRRKIRKTRKSRKL